MRRQHTLIGPSVGGVARQIRKQLGRTLANVALEARISPSMLSRIESGHASPSLATTVALARALSVAPALLLQDLGSEEGNAQHVSHDQGLKVSPRVEKRGHACRLLASLREPRWGFEPVLVTMTDESEVCSDFQHKGTEFVYILAGELSYRHGAERFLLKQGDALTFRRDVANGPERLIKVPIRMLCVVIGGPALGKGQKLRQPGPRRIRPCGPPTPKAL